MGTGSEFELIWISRLNDSDCRRSSVFNDDRVERCTQYLVKCT